MNDELFEKIDSCDCRLSLKEALKTAIRQRNSCIDASLDEHGIEEKFNEEIAEEISGEWCTKQN